MTKTWEWDIDKHYIEEGAFDGVDTIIHLAGAGIADKPWTKARKRELLESRTHSTRLLYDELRKRDHTVTSFISASAIGYYGFADDNRMLVETDPAGTDFQAGLVKKWEQEIDQVLELKIRVVKVRIGVVLTMEGGALKEIARPVKLWAGAPLGSGNQFMSWIHIDDLCRIFTNSVENPSFVGTYNAVAPNPVTNRELTKAIARVLRKPMLLPSVPAFTLKVLFGEMADLVLKGSKVSSERLERTGFEFKYPSIDEALADLLS
jgi:uncharacterized protein (TIGR01777 family)